MRRGALCLALVLVGCSLGHGTASMWTFDDAPGASPVDEALKERLSTAWAARTADDVPRTQPSSVRTMTATQKQALIGLESSRGLPWCTTRDLGQ